MTQPAGAGPASRAERGLTRWRAALLVTATMVFALAFARLATRAPAPGFLAAPPATNPVRSGEAPDYRIYPVSHGRTPFAHSVAAVDLPGHGPLAFWYAGTREGASDSVIYASAFDAASNSWGAERIVVGREALERAVQRSIRKIGNPTVLRDEEGRLWLFFVSASVGGWAGSAINLTRSGDGGQHWEAPRRLITSPFLNLSTLVKGAPVLYVDGSIGLPVYHEFIGKFGELLRVSRDGRVLAKRRLDWGKASLQPVVLPRSETEAVAFMRYAGKPPGRVLVLRTADAGHTWSEPARSALPNPNSGIDALRLDDGGLLLAFNNREASRDNLSLAHSRDEGNSWRVIHAVEDVPANTSANPVEFSYPWLLRTEDRAIHLLYTVDKKSIRHLRFNRAWLRERLR
ncbi:MAG: exo-alpha-sialidase [Betaproteobacteria bacterium]|nr:exo-alpha-sialidase [Betaproteobacteria bacterium]